MISANNITLRIGKKALFEDVNIKFTEGNCYGLIGANGAGKSTFLKILSGQLEPTSGDIAITPGQRLSFLQQDHFKYDEFTVLDTVIMGNKRLYEIMSERHHHGSVRPVEPRFTAAPGCASGFPAGMHLRWGRSRCTCSQTARRRSRRSAARGRRSARGWPCTAGTFPCWPGWW